MDADLVRELARLLDETGLSEIEYSRGEWRVRVAKAPPAATAVPASALAIQLPEAAPTEAAADQAGEDFAGHPGVITSPMVGVVYTSESPDAPPFVKVGDTVTVGQTLLLIEAMKVFNPIVAPRPGKVARILVGSGVPVEFGEPLIVVE
ncbi:MAG: acetyl-CoA carboxylase biotin carboxyl carrier protein [Rhodospirillales bacterium]|nr:acetyl-CoA carboxylase biotin carboxyl carrier protein [Rhodospirillales bacterium]